MFFYKNDQQKKELGDGLARRVLARNDDMMAVEVTFETGAVGAIHTHPHTQISYVLSGKFEATIGDEIKIISTGDTYITPPDIPHGVICLETGALLDVFTPQRKDFL